MKKLLLTSVLVLAASSNASWAMDKPYIEKALVEVCEAIKSNSKLKLSKTLRSHKLSYGAISKKLVCNGHDVLTFATLNGADKNAQLLATQLSKDKLKVLVKR